MPEVLDFRDPEWVADKLNIDKNAVYRYLNEGVLPGMQLGRKWLISESSLAEFLKAEERRQTQERRLSPGGNSVDRYTPRAQRALAAAQEEALTRQHNFIGTEHLLLGLVRDPANGAIPIIERLGLQPAQVVTAVEGLMIPGGTPFSGAIGLTHRARRALDLAVEEADRMNQPHVGCEHLLLGLIAEKDGMAGSALSGLGVTLNAAREHADALAAAA